MDSELTGSLNVLAAAKLNLCLRIVGRRDDGYHLLDSIMVPISIFDRLVVTAQPATSTSVAFGCDAVDLPTDERNSAVRAAHLFLTRTGSRQAVSIHLHKQIPVGAGLGGGSSDAAAILVGLNQLLRTQVDAAELARWGAEIGADVPFFIVGRPARVRGVGELIDPLASWPSWAMVVVFPGVSLVTADVYRAYDALTKETLESSIRVSVNGETSVRDLLVNDLESAAIQIYPPLKALQRRLMDFGALGAAMTGSGSAMFGVWPDQVQAEAAAAGLRREGLWAHAVEILSRSAETVEA